MVDLPKRKVGIVACSGEELPEGTVTRLAALRVLESLRLAETVTICLPLFLAGGEGDRAFARFYPTIAIDGCELRCAARATDMYSGKPAASLVVTQVQAQNNLPPASSRRRLDDAGMQAVQAVAGQVAAHVDRLLAQPWSRREENLIQIDAIQPLNPTPPAVEAEITACACGSGIPVQRIQVGGQVVALAGLPLIFAQLAAEGKTPCESTTKELLEITRLYNPVPEAEAPQYRAALASAYAAYLQKTALDRKPAP